MINTLASLYTNLIFILLIHILELRLLPPKCGYICLLTCGFSLYYFWSKQDNLHWSFNWGPYESLYTWEIELIHIWKRYFQKFYGISRLYMPINGHKNRIFYQFLWISMTFPGISRIFQSASVIFHLFP